MATIEPGTWCDHPTGECLYSAELAALRKDAERYRWMRKSGAWESEIGMDVLSERPERFDAAVDAAMAADAAGTA